MAAASGNVHRSIVRQRGGHSVEFALVAMIFFLAVFGIVEFARMLYVFNTVQEVTRRAATAAIHANFRDSSQLQQIRENSILRNSPGVLPLGSPVTDQHVRIDFLSLVEGQGGTLAMQAIPEDELPACPLRNRQVCMANPNASNCIRYVRARICDPDDRTDCQRAQLRLMIPLVQFDVAVPVASTLLPSESLGYLPGMGVCP